MDVKLINLIYKKSLGVVTVGEDVLQEPVDGHVNVGVVPGGHVPEPDHVVVLDPGLVLPPAGLPALAPPHALHVALVPDQHHRHLRPALLQLHGADVVRQPSQATQECFSSTQKRL